MSGVNNYCIAVKEQGDDIVFLRKIVRGGADKSYGIQVAKLAGVPEPRHRAGEGAGRGAEPRRHHRAGQGDRGGSAQTAAQRQTSPGRTRWIMHQMSLFDTVKDDDIVKELKELELSHHDADRRIEYAVPAAERS